MANVADPDQTAPLGSALSAKTCLFEHLESSRYVTMLKMKNSSFKAILIRKFILEKSLHRNAHPNKHLKKFELKHNKSHKMTCAPSKDTDQTVQPHCLFSLHGAVWVAKDPMFPHADSKDCDQTADANADLSLCWAQR